MSDDHKKRIAGAINSYIKKHTADTDKLKRTHGKPEKLVEKSVMQWLSSQNIYGQVVESKAVYSSAAGRYLSGQTTAGTADIIGLNDQGLFVAIELKAPGRRTTLRAQQRDFLMKIIQMNGFACVTDSVEHLSSLYFAWLSAPVNNRQAILLNDLPTRRRDAVLGAAPLFED